MGLRSSDGLRRANDLEPTRIAAMESVSLCDRMKGWRRIL
jgi:hypothetical protein